MHKGNWFVCATGGGIKFRCREVDSVRSGIVCETDIKLYVDSTKYTSARSDACMHRESRSNRSVFTETSSKTSFQTQRRDIPNDKLQLNLTGWNRICVGQIWALWSRESFVSVKEIFSFAIKMKLDKVWINSICRQIFNCSYIEEAISRDNLT